jgi:tetratricopeptide (TPR) repeat protein
LAVSLANESFEHLALHELHKWICIHQARELPADNSQNTSLFHQYMPLDRTEFGKASPVLGEKTIGPFAGGKAILGIGPSCSASGLRTAKCSLHSLQFGPWYFLTATFQIIKNILFDYDRAVDCLHAALSLKPEVAFKLSINENKNAKTQDPVLWNRLGATLANADRTAEAINAYKRSLQISPFYVRARYNLGIACMNLNSYRQTN